MWIVKSSATAVAQCASYPFAYVNECPKSFSLVLC